MHMNVNGGMSCNPEFRQSYEPSSSHKVRIDFNFKYFKMYVNKIL